MKELTLKQKKFVDAYIESGNATKAAKVAGYSEKTAYSEGNRLLKNAEVKQAIDDRMNQLKNENTADLQEILEKLTDIIRDKETEEVLLVVKGGGVERFRKRVSVRDKIRAIDMLGKLSGWFVGKGEITLRDCAPIVIVDDVHE